MGSQRGHLDVQHVVERRDVSLGEARHLTIVRHSRWCGRSKHTGGAAEGYSALKARAR